MKKPTQCIFWKDPELVRHACMEEQFELVMTYEKESHNWTYLLKCRECGQFYLFHFYEEIDWVEGNDPQYCTYIPVEIDGEVEKLSKGTVPLELLQYSTLSPRLHIDYPGDAEKSNIYWTGK